MKLEIKHLTGYLPYGLKAKMNIFGDNQTEVVIEGLSTIGEVELSGIRTTVNEFFDISEIKPILRPLSDLTKEIEVNGGKFVPIEYNAFKHSKEDIIEFQNKFIHYKAMKFGIIERFLEWHFDIYGLIENGLAIDINTLK